MALAPNEVGDTERDRVIALIASHRAGDEDAFPEIVHGHYPALMASARRRLFSLEDAEDAVQETLLRAYKGLHSFGKGGDWRLGAWLNRILFTVCAEIATRRRHTLPLDEELADARQRPAHADTGDTISDHVALDAVKRAIGTLPASQRQAFLMRMVDELPYEVVAGELGISEENARARVARARTTLQRVLARSAAVSGSLAAAPLVLRSAWRGALRRLLVGGGGGGARALGESTGSGPAELAGSAQAPATQLFSQLSTSPIVTQLSTTSIAQAAVAVSAAPAGKTPVVLGLVASLAAAGGLSGAGAAGHQAPAVATLVSQVAAAPAAVGTPLAPAAPSAVTPPDLMRRLEPPTWLTKATTAPVDDGTVQATPAATGATTQASTAGQATTATTPTTSTTPSAPPASPPATTSTSTTGSATVTPTTSTLVSLTLPAGTCTGVTGFAASVPKTTTPVLGSDALVAMLSTGAVTMPTTGGAPGFSATASVESSEGAGIPVDVKVGSCLAADGSILVVDLTGSTGAVVQLVGSLVATPEATTGATPQGTAAHGVAYLFRGTVTEIAGPTGPAATLPWGLTKDFVAEVQVSEPANTATLTVAFIQPQVNPAATAPPPAGTPATSSTSTSSTTSTSSSTSSSATGPTAATASTAASGASNPSS